MSNNSKDNTSIRVHAPPGGHSSNIFGTSESQQSAANKKHQMDSDIFGSKKDSNEPTPVQKQNRNTGNNIFGTDPPESNTKGGTVAGQYKQTQMKSNIFATEEPTTTRHVSDKNKSNIFGVAENDDQNKRHTGVRQGLRDPNASRMGYNPINGESYATKDNENSKSKQNEKQTESIVETNEHSTDDNKHLQGETTNSDEKSVEKSENSTNGNNSQKSIHTSVRVFQPPGGKSHGPLW